MLSGNHVELSAAARQENNKPLQLAPLKAIRKFVRKWLKMNKHLAEKPSKCLFLLERETGFEPATISLGS